MKKVISIALCLILACLLLGCSCDKAEGEKFETKVYFVSENLELAAETREVFVEEREKCIAQEVIKGPNDEGLSKPINGDVKVLSARTDADGVCTIDLSKEFAEENTGGTLRESLAIYALVNSLCELDYVKEVKINIDGDEEFEFGGHFDFSDTFEYDWNMIRIEDRE